MTAVLQPILMPNSTNRMHPNALKNLLEHAYKECLAGRSSEIDYKYITSIPSSDRATSCDRKLSAKSEYVTYFIDLRTGSKSMICEGIRGKKGSENCTNTKNSWD